MHFRSIVFVGIVAAAGCAQEADTGTLELALVASTADGTQYRLPDDAQIHVAGTRFSDNVPLAGDATSVDFNVPVGMYSLTLQHPYGFTTEWPLYRTNPDSSVDTVWATLVTPMPAGVQVMPNQTTGVTLTFRVPGSGTIVFAKGAISVTTEVETVPASSALISVSGTLAFGSTGGSLATLGVLPTSTTVTDASVLASITGNWEMVSLTMACAPILIETVGGNHTGFMDHVSESQTGTSTACIYPFMDMQFFEIRATRTGSPMTSTYASVTGTTTQWTTRFVVQLAEPVLVGDTLDLGKLDGVYGDLPVSGTLTAIDDVNIYYSASFTMTNQSFAFTPRE